jgi:hypothetical protein
MKRICSICLEDVEISETKINFTLGNDKIPISVCHYCMDKVKKDDLNENQVMVTGERIK